VLPLVVIRLLIIPYLFLKPQSIKAIKKKYYQISEESVPCMIKSIELYRELLDFSKPKLMIFLKNFPLHESQLNFSELNEECYRRIYIELRQNKKVMSRKELIKLIPGLGTVCKNCWKFFISPRSNSIKSLDIEFGKKFEEVFMNFLSSKGFVCKDVDQIKKNYPNIAILDPGERPVCYLELKYIAAPFLTVYRKIKGRECYEGSLTLDVDEKLKLQRKIVEEEIKVPVFYVYWADFPCIKGIFFVEAEKVYGYVDKVGLEYTRKVRRGNFIQRVNGEIIEIGHREKVYLPLFEMEDFERLLEILTALIKRDCHVSANQNIF
jgi:hypothetical protein